MACEPSVTRAVVTPLSVDASCIIMTAISAFSTLIHICSSKSKGGGIGAAGAAMAAPLFSKNMATPYHHALIKHPARTVQYGHVRARIDGAAAVNVPGASTC